MAFPHTENWDGVVSPAIPSGWTVQAGSPKFVTTASAPVILSSPNTITLAAGSAGKRSITWGTADSTGGNCTVIGTGMFGGWPNSDISVFARCNSSTADYGSSTLYDFCLSGTDVQFEFNKVVGGVLTNLVIVSIASLQDSVYYRISATLTGTGFLVSCQRLSDSFWLNSAGGFQAGSAFAISATDGSISGSGFTGWASAAGASGQTWADDWSCAAGSVQDPIFIASNTNWLAIS